MNFSATRYLPSLGWLRLWRRPSAAGRAALAGRQEPAVTGVEHLNLAFHRAYRRLTNTHLHWVQRGFDDHLLRPLFSAALARAGRGAAITPALPTATSLAAAWDRQFGLLASAARRTQQQIELTRVADDFLYSFQQEWNRIVNNHSPYTLTLVRRWTIDD